MCNRVAVWKRCHPVREKFKLYYKDGVDPWVLCCSGGRLGPLHKSREDAERCLQRIKAAFPDWQFKIEVA